MSKDDVRANGSNSTLKDPEVPRAFLNSLSDSTAILDEDGRIVAVNDTWIQFAEDNGLSDNSEPVGDNYLDVSRNADDAIGDRAADRLEDLLENGTETIELDYPCHSPDEQRWFEMRAGRFEWKGDTYITVTHLDITERKLKEIALEESEARINHLMKEAPTVIFSLEPEPPFDVTWMCPNISHVLGESSDAYEEDPQLWWEHLPEDERGTLEATLNSLEPGKNESIDHRWIKDDRTRWLRSDLRLVSDSNGEPLEIIGTAIDVSKEKQVKKTLREKNELLDAINDQMPGVIYQFKVTPEGEFFLPYMSEGYEELTGVPAEEAMEDFDNAIKTVHPDDVDDLMASIQAVVEEPQTWTEDMRFVRPDGTVKWLQGSSRPDEKPDGSIVFSGVINDVTDRKKLEQELTDRTERQELAQNIASLGHWNISFPDETVHWSDEVYRILGFDPEGDEKAQYEDVPSYYHEDDRERVISELNSAIDEGEPAEFEARIVRPDGEVRHVTCYGIPRYTESGELDDLFGVFQDITERTELKRELAEQNERYELAQQIANLGHWSVSLPDREIQWSDEIYRIHGLDPADPEPSLEEAFELYVEEDRNRIQKQFERAIESNSKCLVEGRIERSDGAKRHVRSYGRPLTDESGTVTVFFGIIQDITDQQETELALRKSEQRFRELSENLDQVFWVIDPDFNEFQYASPRYEDWFGQTVEELYEDNYSWMNKVHPDDREDLTQTINQHLIEATTRKEYEKLDDTFRIENPDGGWRWCRAKGTPITNEHGRITRIIGFITDITERKKREEKLRKNEQRFRQMAENIDVVYYNYEPDFSEAHYISPAYEEIWGRDVEELHEDLWNFADAIVEADRNRVIKRKKELIENELKGDTLIEYRIRTPEGEVKWIEDEMFGVRKDGTLDRIVGYARDITKRKTFEQKLRKSEQRFRELAENINEVFWISSPETDEMIYVSPAYENIWGRSVESFYENPRSFLEAIHPEDRRDVENALPRQKTGEYDVEYRVEQPDGEIRWIRDRAFPIEDENGEVHRIVGIAEDITEDVEIQEQLHKMIDEKETLLQEVHHRVKNNLQVVLGLLGLQAREVNSDAAQVALNNSKQRIHSMAMTHKLLYEGAHLANLNMENYLGDLIDQIQKSLESNTEHTIELSVDPIKIEPDTAISVGLIVNELVTNALKHGLKDRDDGLLSIEFTRVDGIDYRLIVEDNGEGINPEVLKTSDSLGMRLVRNLAENQLHGEIEITSDSGLKISVTFPPIETRYENQQQKEN